MATEFSAFKRHAPADKPPSFLLYGTAGIAKTTMAAQAPNPIFLCTEDGLGLNQVDAFDPPPRSWADVINYMGKLFNEQHTYKTFVVDSLSALEPMIWKQVAEDGNKASIEELGYGKGYVMALEYWQQFWSGVSAIRDQKGIMPIMIAHADIVKYDSPQVEPFDRYHIKLHKRAAQLLCERCDIVGFANWETLTTHDRDPTGFNSKKGEQRIVNVRGVGTGRRLLHLVEKPAYIAKNRYGLPETIPLSWQSFSDALSAAFPKPQQPTIKSVAKTAGE